MKKNARLLLIPVLLVLLFTVFLLLWTHFLSSRPVEPKESPAADTINTSFFEPGLPASQKKLKQKFSAYQTESERDGKRILTLFTPEQTKKLLAARETGERKPLSFDEILFLINDSIRLYESCDEIVLTGASSLPFFPENRKGDAPDHRILCERGDLSALAYGEALRRYQCKLRDIRTMIVYRIWLLDAGLTSGMIEAGSFSGVYGFHSAFKPGERAEDHLKNSLINRYNACALLLDPEDELPRDKEYRETLTEWYSAAFGRVYGTDTEAALKQNLKATKDSFGASTSMLIFREAPVLFGDVLQKPRTAGLPAVSPPLLEPLLSPNSFNMFFSSTITLDGERIFPTEALLEEEPVYAFNPSALETDTLTFSAYYPGSKTHAAFLCTVSGETAKELLAALGDPAGLFDALSQTEPRKEASLDPAPRYWIDFNNGTVLTIPLFPVDGEPVAIRQRSRNPPLSSNDPYLFDARSFYIGSGKGDQPVYYGLIPEAFCARVREFLVPYAGLFLNWERVAAKTEQLFAFYRNAPSETKLTFSQLENEIKYASYTLSYFSTREEIVSLPFWEETLSLVREDPDARLLLLDLICRNLSTERKISTCGLYALLEADPAVRARCEKEGYTPTLTPYPILELFFEAYGIA
ncbi:MAG: hypothetical protein II771_08710 [Clostridia bacterium]|nr:hypothetical protein [Clostridia bacterium]